MNDADNFKVDIITASIGAYSNWATDPWAVVASRLVDEGIVVTIAAGNDGEEGRYFLGMFAPTYIQWCGVLCS